MKAERMKRKRSPFVVAPETLSMRLKQLHARYTYRTMSALSGVNANAVRRATLREWGDRTYIERRNLELLEAFVSETGFGFNQLKLSDTVPATGIKIDSASEQCGPRRPNR